jgi:hypothetical protein
MFPTKSKRLPVKTLFCKRTRQAFKFTYACPALMASQRGA